MTIITPNHPIKRKQLEDLRDEHKQRAERYSRQRLDLKAYSFDDMIAHADNRYWQGRVDQLNDLLKQLGDIDSIP